MMKLAIASSLADGKHEVNEETHDQGKTEKEHVE